MWGKRSSITNFKGIILYILLVCDLKTMRQEAAWARAFRLLSATAGSRFLKSWPLPSPSACLCNQLVAQGWANASWAAWAVLSPRTGCLKPASWCVSISLSRKSISCSLTPFVLSAAKHLRSKLLILNGGNLFCQGTDTQSLTCSQSNSGELKSWQNYLL